MLLTEKYPCNLLLYSHNVEHGIAGDSVIHVMCMVTGACPVSWWHHLLLYIQDFRHDGTLKQKLSKYLTEALQDPSTFEGEKEQMKRIIEWVHATPLEATRSTRNCDTHTWTLIRAYILYVKLQCWIESCSIYSLHNPNTVHVSCISNMNMYIRTLTCTTQVLVAIRIYVCVLSLFVVWYRSQRQFLRCRGTNSG